MLLSTLLALIPLAAAAPLTKRQTFGGRATFYDVGLGACGGYNIAEMRSLGCEWSGPEKGEQICKVELGTDVCSGPGDYIVALNSAQYGGGYPGPNCGRSLTISYGGKTAVATVRDECPTCGYGDLDLSRGLFNNFANEGMGQFQMQWWWNNGNSQPQAQPSTTPSPTPTQAPTSAYTPPPSTTQSPAPAPTTSTSTVDAAAASSASSASSASAYSSASSSSSSASAAASAAAASSSAASLSASAPDVVPTSVASAGMGNLAMINQVVANMGRVIVVAATT